MKKIPNPKQTRPLPRITIAAAGFIKKATIPKMLVPTPATRIEIPAIRKLIRTMKATKIMTHATIRSAKITGESGSAKIAASTIQSVFSAEG